MRNGTLLSPAQQLIQALDDFVERVDGVCEAAIVSAEGLPLVVSKGLGAAAADRFAAVASGLFGLAKGASSRFDSGVVSEVIVEFEKAQIVVSGIVDGSVLSVVATTADLGEIAYEMALLAGDFGELLDTGVRVELQQVHYGRALP
ncbi:MAG: roadblock/LC7 domain-containing protein [Acidimicrobiales bacterium]